jgi:hypothetical protein
VCKFTGTIPWSISGLFFFFFERSISGLVRLKELDISENNFDAELPPPIGRLGNPTQLAKAAGLKGSIPKELSNCK